MSQTIAGKPARWWEIALLTIAVTLLSRLTTGNPQKESRAFYERKTKQPAWAPPGWVFAPAWTINNIFLLKALLELLRTKKGLPRQKQLLILQMLIWGVFCSFGYFYFRKQSVLIGGVLTVADAGFALASFIIARGSDKKFANQYLPLLLWTTFASTLAVPQAVWNDDPFLGVKALIK
jgi:tryptophan-rich sensory protein